MIVKGTSLKMTRGDSEQLTVYREDSSGTQIDFETGDTVYFTVKTSIDTEVKTLQKTVTSFTDGKAIVNIAPEDTSSLAYGTYCYDVQVTEASGDVTTIITNSKFVLAGEVTYD